MSWRPPSGNGFVFWFQDYPRASKLVGLLLVDAWFIVSVVGFALFSNSFYRTRERVFQLVTFASLPMLFVLSNLSWPMEATPRLLVRSAQLLPSTPGINAMVKLNQMGARLSEVSADLANLAILALLYGALPMWQFRPDPASSTTSIDSAIDSAVTPALSDHHPQAMSESPPE